MTTTSSVKNPIIAAILNAIIPGVGYLYAGVRKRFAWLLLIAIILTVFVSFDPQSSTYTETNDAPMTLLEYASGLLFLVAFGYDAYVEVKARQ